MPMTNFRSSKNHFKTPYFYLLSQGFRSQKDYLTEQKGGPIISLTSSLKNYQARREESEC